MKFIIFALLVAAMPAYTFYYQQTNVTGRVTDAADGSPIEGATVNWKGSMITTTTDQDGRFSIASDVHSRILLISITGYQSVAVTAAANNKPLIIKMRAEAHKKETPVTSVDGRAPGIQDGAQLSHKTRQHEIHYGEEIAFNTEDYDHITENRFRETSEHPLSTFSIDVDGASYSNVRRFLNNGQLPPAGAVRIEELINYFHYKYPQPKGDEPFSINTEVASCPWNTNNKLVMIGLQGKKIPVHNLPPSNLVFLIDVSGSMEDENKLPLVKSSIRLLIEQLREEDRVSMVVYAGSAGLVLPATSGSQKNRIRQALDRLQAGGSTAGGAGIQLAYKIARENFMEEGNNRVILCTDGDFNVGVSSDASLVQIIERERESGVFLTVLGYGMGNYKDNKMQQLANKGNGNHAYIDNINEAKKVLVNEFGGTLFTIAKDVKLQVEFNPANVQGYRLVGYENRLLNKEDFNNDKKDAGDIGSGHTVTALYEIIPAGVESEFFEKVDPLKYSGTGKQMAGNKHELLNIKFRYKKPDGNKSRLIEHVVTDNKIERSSDNLRFVAAVAEFGMLLTKSEFSQQSSFRKAYELASGAIGDDEEGYRREFLEMIRKAESMNR